MSRSDVDVDALLAEYRSQTLICSVTPCMRRAPAYPKLMELGNEAVPAILAFIAGGECGMAVQLLLWDITGEDPAAEARVEEDGWAKTDVRASADLWLAWGRKRGLST